MSHFLYTIFRRWTSLSLCHWSENVAINAYYFALHSFVLTYFAWSCLLAWFNYQLIGFAHSFYCNSWWLTFLALLDLCTLLIISVVDWILCLPQVLERTSCRTGLVTVNLNGSIRCFRHLPCEAWELCQLHNCRQPRSATNPTIIRPQPDVLLGCCINLIQVLEMCLGKSLLITKHVNQPQQWTGNR